MLFIVKFLLKRIHNYLYFIIIENKNGREQVHWQLTMWMVKRNLTACPILAGRYIWELKDQLLFLLQPQTIRSLWHMIIQSFLALKHRTWKIVGLLGSCDSRIAKTLTLPYPIFDVRCFRFYEDLSQFSEVRPSNSLRQYTPSTKTLQNLIILWSNTHLLNYLYYYTWEFIAIVVKPYINDY